MLSLTEPTYIECSETFITTDQARLMQFFLAKFGQERLTQLKHLLEDLIEDPGYGDIKLVIMDGRVTLLKVEKSYK